MKTSNLATFSEIYRKVLFRKKQWVTLSQRYKASNSRPFVRNYNLPILDLIIVQKRRYKVFNKHVTINQSNNARLLSLLSTEKSLAPTETTMSPFVRSRATLASDWISKKQLIRSNERVRATPSGRTTKLFLAQVRIKTQLTRLWSQFSIWFSS